MNLEQFLGLLTYKNPTYKGVTVSQQNLNFLRELNIYSALAIDNMPEDNDNNLVWISETLLKEAIKTGKISIEGIIDDISFLGIYLVDKKKKNQDKVTAMLVALCQTFYDDFLAEGTVHLNAFVDEVIKTIKLFEASEIKA